MRNTVCDWTAEVSFHIGPNKKRQRLLELQHYFQKFISSKKKILKERNSFKEEINELKQESMIKVR
jgi:aminoglycoside phosphotransferase family enzyme